jgi:hypothetical protein
VAAKLAWAASRVSTQPVAVSTMAVMDHCQRSPVVPAVQLSKRTDDVLAGHDDQVLVAGRTVTPRSIRKPRI